MFTPYLIIFVSFFFLSFPLILVFLFPFLFQIFYLLILSEQLDGLRLNFDIFTFLCIHGYVSLF